LKQLLVAFGTLLVGIFLIAATIHAAYDDEGKAKTAGGVKALKQACTRARELADHAQWLAAQRQFSSLLKRKPTLACAQEGLNAVLVRRCRMAAAMTARGRTLEADAFLVELLEEHPHASCAVHGLRRSAQATCRTAQRLSTRRLAAQSMRVYNALLARVPASGCIVRARQAPPVMQARWGD
jgi:hypothetical protein